MKVIVSLKGGLGNQMFQYATARGIANTRGSVILDTHFFKSNDYSSETFSARGYNLNIFRNLKARTASPVLESILYSNKLIFKILRNLFLIKVREIKQIENEFIPLLLTIKNSVYLDGFFQSEKYFKHIRQELLTEFKFPALHNFYSVEIDNKIKNCYNSVSIHVRRGDYLKESVKDYHGILPLNYYKKAVAYIEETLGINNNFFVFSDDITWCQENFDFLPGKVTMVSNEIAWNDLYLMTQCRHHVIANSSFSWWGAWLSENKGSITIAPLQYFNPAEAKFDIHDFIPDSWILIDNE